MFFHYIYIYLRESSVDSVLVHNYYYNLKSYKICVPVYGKNLNGLIECYFLAIPFFKNTFFSTIIFSYATLIIYKSFTKRQNV